eukprot:COSAG03_NODE_454_length_7774_cov_50.681433_2_plen_260_part_00
MFDPLAVDIDTATEEEIDEIAVMGDGCDYDCDYCRLPDTCVSIFEGTWAPHPMYEISEEVATLMAAFDDAGVPEACAAAQGRSCTLTREPADAWALYLEAYPAWESGGSLCSSGGASQCGGCYNDCFDDSLGYGDDAYEATATFTAPTTGTFVIKVSPQYWGSYQVIVSGGDDSCTPQQTETTCGDGNDADGNACEVNAQADGCVVDSGSCDFVQMANFECDCGTVKDCLLLACNATDAPCQLGRIQPKRAQQMLPGLG